MKNKKGFTLIELLAVILILGLVMVATIPNIIGLNERNKAISYSEDARKMKSNAEYMFRGREDVRKPRTGECIAINLGYVDDSDFDIGPYSGYYDKNYSFIVITKNAVSSEYEYFIQLIEVLPEDAGYRGYTIRNVEDLKDEGYMDLDEGYKPDMVTNLAAIALDDTTHKSSFTKNLAKSNCTNANTTFYFANDMGYYDDGKIHAELNKTATPNAVMTSPGS